MKSVIVVLLSLCVAWSSLAAEESITYREWVVDGVKREALVSRPASGKPQASPVIFVFHGHGGTMRNALRTFPLATFWPEAVVVYMQGLNTPGYLTDPEGKKSGWQNRLGKQDDRDLKFFDAVLRDLKKDGWVDDLRVFATGHSNGGGFTYLLWAARGDVFAAMAPSSSVAGELPRMKPKPVMHIAGETDPLVKYEWQKATIARLVKLNQAGSPKDWDQDKNCSLYPSDAGTPVVTAIHPGGHNFHKDAPELMVKFFKQHRLKAK